MAVLATGLCVVIARQRTGGEAAALLGAAAGISFAGVAALVKSSTALLAQGVPVLLASWQPYAALAVGAVGIVVSQLAFRAGPLAASLPAMNSINPLVSVLIGAAVFDEHFRSGLMASTVEALALAVVTVTTVLLSRVSRLENAGASAPSASGQVTTEKIS